MEIGKKMIEIRSDKGDRIQKIAPLFLNFLSQSLI
jgi:hypothetical protein